MCISWLLKLSGKKENKFSNLKYVFPELNLSILFPSKNLSFLANKNNQSLGKSDTKFPFLFKGLGRSDTMIMVTNQSLSDVAVTSDIDKIFLPSFDKAATSLWRYRLVKNYK